MEIAPAAMIRNKSGLGWEQEVWTQQPSFCVESQICDWKMWIYALKANQERCKNNVDKLETVDQTQIYRPYVVAR